MRTSIKQSVIGVLGLGLSLSGAALAAPKVLPEQALVNQYCTSCHNPTDYAAGFDIEAMSFDAIGPQAEQGEKIVRKLRSGMMPPGGQPHPSDAQLQAAVKSLEGHLDAAAAAKPHQVAPGAHRMNRAEYANAIHDLLDLDVDPAGLFPVDDTSYGFDNMAGSLGSSPALVESYVQAAAKISRLAMGMQLDVSQKRYMAPPDFSQNEHVEGAPFGTRGGLVVKHYFPADGEYIFGWAPVRTNAGGLFGDATGEQLELAIDGQRVKLFDFAKEIQASGRDDRHEVKVKVTAGDHDVTLAFLARTHIPSDDLNRHWQRTTLTQDVVGFTFVPHINAMTILGPFDAQRPHTTVSREHVMICQPTSAADEPACAERIISRLVTQAFRRPATPADVQRLMKFYSAGRNNADFDTGIQRALQVVLTDPEFIYRTEGANLVKTAVAAAPGRINDYELASRMSFFLWSSPPDADLVKLAAADKLHEPSALRAQVKRMLADPRSESLVSNFAAQWLQLRNLQSAAPVADLFPDFDDNLRQAMLTETDMLLENIIRQDRPVTELLDANYTFLNERLARHYGIPGVYGSQFRRVELPADMDYRRGLLGKGSVLTVSSVADRTSPVLRGKWVMINLLGVQPPDPPSVVPALPAAVAEDGPPITKPVPVRVRMEEHRKNPQCAGCHQMMDPIGFSLDAFDRTGAYRTEENGVPLDLSGSFRDGQKYVGPTGLRNALMKYKPQFVENMAERMLTYAVGRGLEYYDMPTVRAVTHRAEADGYRFSSMVLGIVESPLFQEGAPAEKRDTRTAMTEPTLSH